ncbi:MAG TPA: chemotaxis protein CheW [Allocoleopsis sp.]
MEFLDWELPSHHFSDTLSVDPFSFDTQQQPLLTRCLRFPLNPYETALVPLEQITEVSEVNPTAILTVPELPAWVLGIYHWRGEMLWLVDLNQLVGYPSVWQRQPLSTAPMMLVVQVNHQAIGIVVPQVNDMELHPLEQMQPAAPGLFSSSLLPLISGVLPDCGDPVLNLSAIALSPLWKKYQGVNAGFSS